MNVTFHNSFLFFLKNGSGSGLREPDCNHYMIFLSQARILTDAASHIDRCSIAWERYTIQFLEKRARRDETSEARLSGEAPQAYACGGGAEPR
jgi:hypothetical protein